MLIGLLLWLTTQKALQRDIPEGYLPVEPIKAGQVMTPQDTITTYYELIGEKNNGFEYPEEEMDWVKNDENAGEHGFVHLHKDTDPLPPEGKYVAVLSANGGDSDSASVDIYLNLSNRDNLLGELDSLSLFTKRWQDYDDPNNWNFHVDLIGKRESIKDTISFLWGDTNYVIEGDHRFIHLCKSPPPINEWEREEFSEELKIMIKENNLIDYNVEGIRLRMFCPKGLEFNTVKLDEIYLWAHRDSVTSITEQPQTNPGYELTDVILGNSNQYNARFPERGTFTIYEGASGRKVREPATPVTPVTVDGNVQLDFSNLPAGVYFGVYEPQQGRRQVQKIIKTR